ncbi:adipose-secreted signaling protein-like [Clytia hemisphaerica]|uniref:Adipose-secreted signaling protein n=2 Tax=Clytia hemisphaerica TaxID=252671 RepID=A0A7M5WMG3_9CNID
MSGAKETTKKERKKIQFTEDVSLSPHGIQCKPISPNEASIDLGLLSSLHTYEVTFDMVHELGNEIQIPPLQSPLIEVTNMQQLSNGTNGHTITLEIKCPECSSLKETICFENVSEQTYELTLTSRIMPHHMGTPALKDGVRLLQGSPGSTSDATDWKGF